jgi:hypothetical protein
VLVPTIAESLSTPYNPLWIWGRGEAVCL